MKWRRFVLLGGSVAVVAILGVVAAWTQMQAASGVSRVHRSDRISQQATLAGLTGQYLQFTFLAAKDAADATHWSLRPNDPADRAELRQLVGASPLTSYGAVLTSLTGQPLTSYPPLDQLPASTDPGFGPLRASLLAGQPGLSGVMRAGGVPVVAFAVPVERRGAVAGLLVSFADVRSWPLQGYDEKLQIGRAAKSYVLDSTGIVAASSDAAALGRSLPGLPEVARSGKSGMATVTGAHDVKTVVSYGPAGHGWTTITMQPAAAFSGGLDASHQHEMFALVVLLTLAVLLLVLFHHKRQQALARLAEERLYDPLTGLAQRRLFELRMRSALVRQKRTGTPLSLLFCDVDHFKSINDRLGHNGGDQVLGAVAQSLLSAVRDDDFVARLGGDEFAVLLEGADGRAVEATAARLRDAVSAPLTVNGREIVPTVSVGGAVLRGPDRAEELLHEADLAMYQAKRSGDGFCLTVVDGPATTATLPQQRIDVTDSPRARK